ncbi:Response regulator receiver domain-containing protein [Fodinibius roseus]|uniref:Response regulator receiver domain-containing protein n=1 Tax=Fodinibius roseus TaxID=1194090 RepID=A0A1M4SJD6_9BACT|nr:response regulator [Fodinibius roseus]SHE32384.1 Response regulator receiver domain-containing protein [Fodinibius roseus]
MELNCIIVEDDPLFRIILKRNVEKQSVLNFIGAAENGREAIKLVNEKSVDLVFLDIGLPDMTGFDVIDRAEDLDPGKVIIISGSKEDGIKAFDYGVTDYIVKPFEEERFNEAIGRFVRDVGRSKKSVSFVDRMIEKSLEYIYTRQIRDFEPLSFRNAKLGYIYPMVTANFDFEREDQVPKILDIAVEEGFLTSEYYDSFYTCNHCSNSYLHFRESCPNCHSTNIESEDQIHHFSCAYMGPRSDFEKSQGSRDLVCPKCDKTLTHIGVDYDKPSEIFECNQCNEMFQDPLVKAKCRNCNSDIKVENLVKKRLMSYQLTSLGKDAAKGQVAVDVGELDTMLDVIDKAYFKHTLAKEIERKKEADFESAIASIYLENISELYDQLGEQRSNNLVRELYEVVLNEVNRSDEIIFKNMVTLWLLITESDLRQADAITGKVIKRIKELLDDNNPNFTLKISKNLQPVETGKSADEQLSQLDMGKD